MFNQFEHRFLPQTETNAQSNDSNEQPLPEGKISVSHLIKEIGFFILNGQTECLNSRISLYN